MTNYKEIILNLLLDKYERSKSFTGDNKVEQRFSVKIATLFPKYGDEAEYDLFNALNEAVFALSEMDFVSFQCKKNGVIENVSLKFTRLYDAYAYLTRTPKAETNRNLTGLLEQYDGKNDLLTRFCTVQKERIAKNKRAEYFDGDIAEYEKLLKAVSVIFDVAEETFIRDFSIRVFGDSKSFEAIKGKVKRLLFQYGDFPDEETVLEDLNIVKNPGHIYMKGSALIQISGQTIDLSKLNGDVAISSALLPDVEKITVTGKKIMSIENLTSFHAFSEKDTFAVYLGGYHNTHRRRFIQQLFKDNPTAAYYHFGDIDAGGFYILLHLRNKTGVPFLPYHMDISTLQQYCDYTKQLTENDVKRLKKLADTEFSDTINYMLTNNCKLEQEAMDI
ncbi:Wadjet anti-phage system protein JetD domain-containing protein [Ruminococcus sp.]